MDWKKYVSQYPVQFNRFTPPDSSLGDEITRLFKKRATVPDELDNASADLIFQFSPPILKTGKDYKVVVNRWYKNHAAMSIVNQKVDAQIKYANVPPAKTKLGIFRQRSEWMIRVLDIDGDDYNDLVRTELTKANDDEGTLDYCTMKVSIAVFNWAKGISEVCQICQRIVNASHCAS